MNRSVSSERRAAFKIRYAEGDEPVPGYRLIKRLGQGGVGQVFKAIGPGGVAVALKIIGGLDQAGGRKELRALQNVKNIGHANLVSIFGFWLKDEDGNIIEFNADEEQKHEGHDSGSMRPAQLFVVMRLCEGSLFDRFLECRKKGLAGIPEEELIGYCEDAARAIDYLNTRCNMQHCDIKPHNILIVGGTAQVCDYGLVKDVDDPHRSTNMVSPLYAAPELLPVSAAEPGPSHATDQCSLAMSYVELRTGKLPFAPSVNPDNPFQVMQAVGFGELDFSRLSDREARVIARATSRDPNSRYESCVKMVRELRRAVEGVSDTATSAPAATTPIVVPVAPYRHEYQEGDEAVPGYKLLKKINDEGTDKFFLATARDGSTVALKIVYDLDEATGRRELAYLQKMRDIRHPYLVPVYGAWLKYDDGTLVDHNLALEERAAATTNEQRPRRAQVFVAVQPCEGNLRDRLLECQHEGKDGIPVDELAGYVEEASRAIDYLNQVHGVAHRDIKPQNIMLVGGVALVGNFGLARNPYDPRRGFDDAFPYYAAPELLPQAGLSGERAATATSDLYSLAVTYAELRTGRLPFRGMDAGENMATIAAGRLDFSRLSLPERRVLEAATALDPARRQVSAVLMTRELRAAVAEHARAEAQHKSGVKVPTPAEPAPAQIKAPYKPRYEEGDEPIPGYKLIERLGTGVDDVFQAVGPDGLKLALKICYNHEEPEARAELRFLQRMSSVRHPHLVAIDELWLKTEDGVIVGPSQLGDDPLPEPVTSVSRPPRDAQLFLAMPLCDGNLADRLAETRRGGLPGIPAEELLGYFEEAAKAVDFLHTVLNIQHCNLKPENILILGGVAQLGDLSSSRSPLDMRGTMELLVPFYAPPELLPVSDADPAPAPTSDQYSLAMCYIELRTGKLPLKTRNVVEAMLAISTGELDLSDLADAEKPILAQSLALDPNARFSSATKMVRALRRAVEGATTGTGRADTSRKVELKSHFQARYVEGDEPIPGYRLLERLGASGYDEVFRAAGPGAKKIALKIVYGLDEIGARRDFRRLQRAKEIRHSHLVDIDDIWLKDHEGNLFDQNTLPDDPAPPPELASGERLPAQVMFSMPLGESSLAEQLAEMQKSGAQGIPKAELIGSLESAAKAIDHLNNVHGTPHGAIEPRHLLILGGAIRLSDFALSRDRPLGTPLTEPVPPYYTAPELLAEGDERPLGNVRSDLYALAMSYVHLSTGRLPFASSDPAEVRRATIAQEFDFSKVPPAERQVIDRALKRRPEKRFASAGEFIRALRQTIENREGVTLIEPTTGGSSGLQMRYPVKAKYAQDDVPVPGYKLVELIGRGGFGEVWKAKPPGAFREVALKIVYDAGGQLGQRELLGLWQIKSIRHENMVPIQALWIKDYDGNLVDDEQIAAFEREFARANEQAQHQAVKPGAATVLGAATRNDRTLDAKRSVTAAGVKAAPPASGKSLEKSIDKGQTLVPLPDGRLGTMMFGMPPAEPQREHHTISQGAQTREKTVMESGPEALPPARPFEPAQLFIAMELCDGHLLHRLNRCKEQGLPGIPPQELLAHMDLAADVIDEFNLRHHVRHRDIKPQNLLTIGKSIKVCDFGLVRKSVGASQTQGLAFTPEYAAPEQVRGEDFPTTDQYCLAVTYAQLRSGVLPFQGAQPQEIILGKRLPEKEYREFLDLSRYKGRERHVLERALSLDPEARYPSCKEFTTALRHAVFPPAPVQRPQKRLWLVPAAAAMVLMFLLAAITGYSLLVVPRPVEVVGEIEEFDGATVTVVDPQTRKLIAEIPVGDEETAVNIDGHPQRVRDLRPGQQGTFRHTPGQMADRIVVDSAKLEKAVEDELQRLIHERKLNEALAYAAAQPEYSSEAERRVVVFLGERVQPCFDRPLAEIEDQVLRWDLDDVLLLAEVLHKDALAKDLRARMLKVLSDEARNAYSREQVTEAGRLYEMLYLALSKHESEALRVAQRDALLGKIRSLALREPGAADWTELRKWLQEVESCSQKNAEFAALDHKEHVLLRALNLLSVPREASPAVGKSLLELDKTPDWRSALKPWLQKAIDMLLGAMLVDPQVEPDMRSQLAKIATVDTQLASVYNLLEQKEFDEARRALNEIVKQTLTSVQRKTADDIQTELTLKDPNSSADEIVKLVAKILPTANNRQIREICELITARLDDSATWLSAAHLEQLLPAFGRVNASLRQVEFLKCYARLLQRQVIDKFAEQGVIYPTLTQDLERHQVLRDELQQAGLIAEAERPETWILDACWAELHVEDKSPEWSEIEKRAGAALARLTEEAWRPYAQYVEAVVQFKSVNYRDDTDAPKAIFALYENPSEPLQLERRKRQSAEVLLAGAKQRLSPLATARISNQPLLATDAEQALRFLQKARTLWRDIADDEDFNVHLALAHAFGEKPDREAALQLLQSASPKSAATGSARAMYRRHLLLVEAQGWAARYRQNPQEGASLARSTDAFSSLVGGEDLRGLSNRDKYTLLVQPALDLAKTYESVEPDAVPSDLKPQLARLYQDGAKLLREDKPLSDSINTKSDPDLALKTARKWLQQAHRLTPQANLLIEEARLLQELPFDAATKRNEIKKLAEAALVIAEGPTAAEAHGLLGHAHLLEAQAFGGGPASLRLLAQAEKSYDEAIARAPSLPQEQQANFYEGRSAVHLQAGNYSARESRQQQAHLELAEKDAREALKRRRSANGLNSLANSLEDQALLLKREGKYEEAIRVFKDARLQEPGQRASVLASFHLGRCQLRSVFDQIEATLRTSRSTMVRLSEEQSAVLDEALFNLTTARSQLLDDYVRQAESQIWIGVVKATRAQFGSNVDSPRLLEEAYQACVEGCRIAREHGDIYWSYYQTYLLQRAKEKNDQAAVARHADELLRAAREITLGVRIPISYLESALVLLAETRPNVAAKLAEMERRLSLLTSASKGEEVDRQRDLEWQIRVRLLACRTAIDAQRPAPGSMARPLTGELKTTCTAYADKALDDCESHPDSPHKASWVAQCHVVLGLLNYWDFDSAQRGGKPAATVLAFADSAAEHLYAAGKQLQDDAIDSRLNLAMLLYLVNLHRAAVPGLPQTTKVQIARESLEVLEAQLPRAPTADVRRSLQSKIDLLRAQIPPATP